MELWVMAIKEIKCRILVCDECGGEYENGDYIQHWTEGETIADWSDDWYIGEGATDYCGTCRGKVEHDHIWYGGMCEICLTDEPE
jgi:hypothetical protein